VLQRGEAAQVGDAAVCDLIAPPQVEVLQHIILRPLKLAATSA
jgi:hypothetical protein